MCWERFSAPLQARRRWANDLSSLCKSWTSAIRVQLLRRDPGSVTLPRFLGIMYLNCHNPYPQSKIHIRSYSTIHIRIYSTIHNHASLCCNCSTLQNLLKSLYLPLAPEQYLSACSLLCVLLSEHNAIFHKLCDKNFMICLKNTKVKNLNHSTMKKCHITLQVHNESNTTCTKILVLTNITNLNYVINIDKK